MNRLLICMFTALAVFMVPACASEAHADTTDDAYVMILREHGITGSDRNLIRMGEAVCDLRDLDWSPMEIATEIAVRNPELSVSDGAYVVGAAQAAYCPEHEA